jgi:hypothetical protein
MPEAAELEVRTIRGRELKIRWKLARHGEWLAWCYVPSESLLPNEGVGFEARAGSPEAARQSLIDRIEAYLAGQTAGTA